MEIEEIEAKYMKQVNQVPDLNKNTEEFLRACEESRAAAYEVIYKYYFQWQQIREKRDEEFKKATILQFGLPIIDSKIKLFGKRLVMIVARSGYGKTSFMAQMIRNQILKEIRVLVFSCEEAGEDFITRINKTELLDEKMITNFIMCDKGTITLDDIKMSVLKMDMSGIGPDIVYVDQLNKIKPDDSFRGNKHEKIVYISEQLQDVVKIINRPLVILHQANRATEEKDGFMTQANVSDADSIYNESQIVLFLESPEYFEWKKDKAEPQEIFKYIVNVGKNRSMGGWEGAETCYFDRSTGEFIAESDYNNYMLSKKIKGEF
jgi:replicative DNA helicase